MTDSDLGAKDFFTDPSFVPDPQPYFDYLRSQGRWCGNRTTVWSP